MGLDYRRIRITDTILVFIIKKSDLTNKEKKVRDQIESVLTGAERTIIHGNTYVQRNGFNKMLKGIKWDKETEKLFIVVEKQILRGYERTYTQDGVEYYF